MPGNIKMSTKIDLSNAKKKGDEHVQYLPCGIDYSGKAEIQKLFTLNVTETEDEKGLDCRLRGYPLKGKKMSVPEGYTGVVLRDAQISIDEGSGKVMKGVASFDHLTFWNWDREPSRSDKYQQALDWLEVSNVIHGTDST